MEISNLLKALSEFQLEGGFVKATKENPFHKNKYAPYIDVVQKTRPVLDTNGLQIIQYITMVEGKSGIATVLFHKTSQETIESFTELVHKGGDPQAQGSAITYAKRYGYVTILGLLVDADDDGNLAAGVGEVADKKLQAAEFYAEKAKMIKTLRARGQALDAVGELVKKTLNKPRIETLEDIQKVLVAAGVE